MTRRPTIQGLSLEVAEEPCDDVLLYLLPIFCATRAGRAEARAAAEKTERAARDAMAFGFSGPLENSS